MEQAFDFIARTGDGAYVVDAKQRIVLWNAAARRLLGFRPEEVIGRYCYEVLGGTDEEGCVVCQKGCVQVQAATRGQIVATRELRLRAKSNPGIWVSLTTILLPSNWPGLSVLAHIFRDIRENKQLQQDNEQLLSYLSETTPGRQQGRAEASTPAGNGEVLTARETEVLQLLANGASTDTIVKRLRIGKQTVRTHVQNVLQKLGVHSRLEAVVMATRRQLL